MDSHCLNAELYFKEETWRTALLVITAGLNNHFLLSKHLLQMTKKRIMRLMLPTAIS